MTDSEIEMEVLISGNSSGGVSNPEFPSPDSSEGNSNTGDPKPNSEEPVPAEQNLLPVVHIPPNRPKCSKINFLYFLIGLLLLSVVVFLVISWKTSKWPFSPPKPKVCKFDTCTAILRHMRIPPIDPTIDECDDFYSFMCGTDYFIGLPLDPSLTRHNNNQDDLKDYVKKVVNKDERLNDDVGLFWSGFYEKCLKYNTSYERDEEALKAITKAEGWPLTDSSWVEKDFDLTNTLIKMAKFGVQDFGIFDLKFSFDSRYDYEVNALMIRNVKHNFGRDNVSLSEDVAKHYKEIVSDKTASNDTSEVVNLVKRLEEIEDNVLQNSNEHNKTDWANLEDLENWVPAVEWRRLLNSLIPEEHKDSKVHWENIVMVYPREFFEKNLAVLLKETKPKTLFQLFHYISAMRALQLLPKSDVPARHCDKILNSILPIIILPNISYDMINETETEAAIKIAEDVRSELIMIIEENDWMDRESKEGATAKLKNMTFKSTHNTNFVGEKYNAVRYKDIKVKDDDTFLNLLLDVLEWNTKTNIFNIIEHLKHSELVMGENTFLCHYQPLLNMFVIGVQSLYFDIDAPGYFKYATIGRAFAKEIAAVFDDVGKKSIFSNATLTELEERKQCIRTKLDKGELVKKHQREDYVTENLALQVGYRLNKKLGQQERIENYEDVNEDEMFFFSYAKQFCPRGAIQKVITYPTNYDLSNFAQFAETFDCKTDSPMNRKNKCTQF